MAKRRVFKKIEKVNSDIHYLVFRSPRTGKAAKYRKDRRFIVEVRNRKSKRVVGYLNESEGRGKKRRLKPRKFSRTAISTKTKEIFTEKIKASNEFSFEVTFREFIIDQVERQTDVIESIMDIADRKGMVLTEVEAEELAGKFLFRDGYKPITDMHTKKDIANIIGTRIINMLRSEGMRTSPKKFAKSNPQSRRKLPRKTLITVRIGSL